MTDYKTVFQLAQDKGYRLLCARGWSDDGTIKISDHLWGDELECKTYPKLNDILEKSLIELTLIQKWLRNEHKIIVVVDTQFRSDNYWYHINQNQQRVKSDLMDTSYESALLEGIHEALKLI